MTDEAAPPESDEASEFGKCLRILRGLAHKDPNSLHVFMYRVAVMLTIAGAQIGDDAELEEVVDAAFAMLLTREES